MTALEKPKWPRAAALDVVRELLPTLAAACVPDFLDDEKGKRPALMICGSLRRRKEMVGDIEFVYLPRTETGPKAGDLFASETRNLVDAALDAWLTAGVLVKRENVKGSASWGPKNKYARHVASGIPIDFFAATERSFWNLVVCRTGSKENNVAICNAAIRHGWAWHPYSVGFTDETGRPVPVTSEREVFAHAGLGWKEPWER